MAAEGVEGGEVIAEEDMDGGDAEIEQDGAADVVQQEDGSPAALEISKVTCVRRGQSVWLPECTEHAGFEFVRLSKWDRALCKLILGVGLNLHLKRERRDLNRQWFKQMMHLRCLLEIIFECGIEICYFLFQYLLG